MKEFKVGQRVTLSATVKYSNPRLHLVVLQFPDGSETQPFKWELLDEMETDALKALYHVPTDAPHVDNKPQGD